MTNFVLIHGGSHGSCCWNPLISEFKLLGHQAFAFDLPGHGNDQTPRSAVTFESYVEAANDFLRSLDIDVTVLVGHSLAGIILPMVAEANALRISRVVFLAGLVLDVGEAAIDLIPESRRSRYFEIAAESSDNTLSLDFESARTSFFSDISEGEARLYYDHLTPQPFAPYLEPARIAARSIGADRRYVACTKDNAFPYDLTMSLASKLGGNLEKIEAGHDVMLSRPRELAQLLAKMV